MAHFCQQHQHFYSGDVCSYCQGEQLAIDRARLMADELEREQTEPYVSGPWTYHAHPDAIVGGFVVAREATPCYWAATIKDAKQLASKLNQQQLDTNKLLPGQVSLYDITWSRLTERHPEILHCHDLTARTLLARILHAVRQGAIIIYDIKPSKQNA